MLAPDHARFPSFWRLQALGWAGLYGLVLAATIPFLSQAGALKDSSWAMIFMFLASCLLRPICRSLARRPISWLALEIRAFAWSVVLGAGACLLFYELVIWKVHKFRWGDWIADSVDFVVVLFLWCSLYFSLKQWQQSAQERERLLQAESEAREARLSALRCQLNPHFLFNSLNAVSTLVLDGNAPSATRMLAQIGDLLRATLENQTLSETPLSQEIALTELYLAIEQTRLGDRLQLHFAIPPETLDARVPSMLLQPLVENAIRHGVAALVEGGRIAISARLEGDRLRIVIRNSARMAPSERLNGIGLHNTRERLETLYGTEQRLSLEWPQADVCEVTVELPFRTAVEAEEALACAH